ncbi:MAG: group II intron maturase-specific domain-containing protein, partial [Cyanobacteria bacterium J06643_5]
LYVSNGLPQIMDMFSLSLLNHSFTLDMVFILKKDDNAELILNKVKTFLAERGMEISEEKTKITRATDGFDFLGWRFKVQKNGKFRSTPSEENFLAFRRKVKAIVNSSNYGAKVKSQKLIAIVRGWRNYHRFCSNMNCARFSLWFIANRAFKVFLKEKKLNRYECEKLVKKVFNLGDGFSFSENRFVKVKGDKSPYDGDLTYWAKRNYNLYDGTTANLLKKQNHRCGYCGLMFGDNESVHLHHIDHNHNNWKHNNLVVIHQSCHQYAHMA